MFCYQEKLEKNGYIYKGSYSGWYCVADEAFVSEKDIEEIVDEHGKVTKV